MEICGPTSLRTPACTLAHSFHSTSPTSDYFTQTTNTTTTTAALGGPQALLMERWKILGSHLLTGHMSWKTVVALNRKLDEVESVWGWPMLGRETDEVKEYECGLGITNAEQVLEATEEVTPPASDAPERLNLSVMDDQRLDCDLALLERVSRAVAQLQQRQQEFKHLHDVAIAKAEKGAQQILLLKRERDQLEKDVVDDEAELTYLKLKLRIIEVQTLPYVPTKDHDGLAAGIEKWKLDWADVDERYRKRRWKRETICQDKQA